MANQIEAAAAPSGTSSWHRVGEDFPPLPPELAGEIETVIGPPQLGPDGLAYCGTCRGWRWLRPEVELGHRDFGQPRRCPDCADLDRAHRLTRLAQAAGLSDEQRLKTFASFKPRQGANLAVQAAARFARHPDGWLVLSGEPGSGKSHLGLAVANGLVAREQPVVWWYAADLLAEARRLISEHGHHHLLASLKRCPVLILDDLGAARRTDFAIGDFLEPLFDARYRDRLPTLVTLIGDPAAVKEHLSESVGRRMEDRTVCQAIRNEAMQWTGE